MHRTSVLRAAAADDDAAERQARARGARLLRQFIPATHTPARVHLLEAGRSPVHHDFRMRIDLRHVPPRPAALALVFEAAGMRVARHTERWEKVLGV